MQIRSPYRSIILIGIIVMLILSFFACEKRYIHKMPVIDADAEKLVEDTVWSNIHEGRIPMEEIQDAKLAVVQFLGYIGVDHANNFQETLPDPILEFDEVIGDIWEFRTHYGRFDVTRHNHRVIKFSRHDSIPGENIKPSKPEGYTEEEALQMVKDLIRSMIPDFDHRNFILKISSDVESYNFKWHEYSGGEIVSVPPNFVSVIMDRDQLRLKRYSALDYHRWRTAPPKINEKQAKDMAEKIWQGKGTAHKAMLWERIRKGGKEIRTVWTVGVALPNPEGGALEDVIIDADTGEVIEKGP